MRNKIDKLSEQGSYRNSRTVDIGGIPYSMRDILITAPLTSGLNVYLVGATGEGKTQLANDLAGYFGDSYCYNEGRPDFEPSEILKQLNLGNIGKVASTRDLVELTENVRKNLYYVDELNRCPPIVMNYFFNFFDGKLVHNGEVFRLGKNDYVVGYASGNIGDGAYVGISDTDRALKDRMHIIIKLDDPDYITTEEDDVHIFGSKKDPRATLPDKSKDSLDDILVLHQAFKDRELPSILPVLGVYFHKGLDYLENTRRHSKRAIDQLWPNVNEIRQDTDESKIMPLSKRAVLASIGLSQALEIIAEERGYENIDTTSMFLDALRFTVPYSGVLAKQYIHSEKDGDVYAAFDDVMQAIRRDINDKKKEIETAIAFAQYGEKEESILNKINPIGGEGRWAPVRRAIEDIAENPPLKKETLEEIKEKSKKP